MLIKMMDIEVADAMGYDAEDLLTISRVRQLRKEDLYIDLLGQSSGIFEIKVTKAAVIELIRKLDYSNSGGERLWASVF